MITQTDIQKMADLIAERFQPEKIILFGSYARGDATENSDVDLLVIERNENADPKTLRQLAINIRLALYGWKIGIDVLLRTSRQWRETSECSGTVAAAALHEGIVLYG